MNLRQPELFIAVAEKGSFSLGSATVSLSHSTASPNIPIESFGGVQIV
jgi:DNA-binding transcriptional LysR family regulator